MHIYIYMTNLWIEVISSNSWTQAVHRSKDIQASWTRKSMHLSASCLIGILSSKKFSMEIVTFLNLFYFCSCTSYSDDSFVVQMFSPTVLEFIPDELFCKWSRLLWLPSQWWQAVLCSSKFLWIIRNMQRKLSLQIEYISMYCELLLRSTHMSTIGLGRTMFSRQND